MYLSATQEGVLEKKNGKYGDHIFTGPVTSKSLFRKHLSIHDAESVALPHSSPSSLYCLALLMVLIRQLKVPAK